MKRAIALILVCLSSVVLLGNSQCSDSAGTNILIIGTGEAIGYTLNKHAPGAVKGCEEEFDKMMTDTIVDGKPLDPIPAEYIIRYYNTSVTIIAANVEDPDLIIRRLGYLPAMYDAEYGTDGSEIINIKAVPRKALVLFEMGYDTGKLEYLKEQEDN